MPLNGETFCCISSHQGIARLNKIIDACDMRCLVIEVLLTNALFNDSDANHLIVVARVVISQLHPTRLLYPRVLAQRWRWLFSQIMDRSALHSMPQEELLRNRFARPTEQ